MTTRILLARHGETDWNREFRIQGHLDPPLNALGREQAGELARNLADVPLEVVYTSDLRRAVETAEIVAAGRRLEILRDPALREVDTGNWSGLTHDEILERFPGAERHDGETRDQLTERIAGAVHRIAAANLGRHLLIVSHGGALRALWHHSGGEPIERLANCSVFSMAFQDGALTPVG